MEDVEADAAVAFSVRRCPVAEFFTSQGARDLCVHTWCALDFPLAKMWGGSLQRSGTLAGGAAGCDFKWSPRSSPAPLRLHARIGAGGER
jgi:L-2-amino-thiazoline-4-carboxylic acid hydrolase